MKKTPLEIEGPLLITFQKFSDSRGFFMERFHSKHLAELGLPLSLSQINHSRSHPGVLRGLHLQTDPDQGKFVSCIRGKIFDVAVDLRPDSKSYGRSVSMTLDEDHALWIPGGFAHGFYVEGNVEADVVYLVDQLYNPKKESGVLWSDPELGIRWPIPMGKTPLISPKDLVLPLLCDWKKS